MFFLDLQCFISLAKYTLKNKASCQTMQGLSHATYIRLFFLKLLTKGNKSTNRKSDEVQKSIELSEINFLKSVTPSPFN